MNKRTIERNKLKSTLGWMVSLLLLFTLTFFSVNRKSNTLVNRLSVKILSADGDKSLITTSDVAKKINAYLGYDIRQATIEEVQLKELEELIQADERVDNVEIYIDSRNKIHVEIKERKVIVRISNKDISYYLDEDGNHVDIQPGRAVRVPLATGHLEDYSGDLMVSKRRSNLQDIYRLALAIDRDQFLSALIEQIDIDVNGQVIMVPKIGREKISLSVDDLEDKLFKLKYFYKEGLPHEGWSKYSVLDLDIRDQVVATLNSRN
jgi:cell division protein FtsQ